MKKLFVTPENLKVLVGNLKKDCDEFIAPKKEHRSDIIFGDVKRGNSGLLVDYVGNSIISPKAFFLPQTEPLFEIISAKKSLFSPIENKKKRVFYGVRPCDTKAAALMRNFFQDGYVDQFYEGKAERSVLITLACTQRCSEQSFCYEIGSGPVAKSGFDLQLIPLKKGYLVDIGTKKGGRIIAENRKLFRGITPSDEKEAKGLFKNFAPGTKKIDYKKLAGIMKAGKVKESVWDDIGLRCIVCSGCITVCPTCSCFGVADKLNGDKGLRIRYCDGCPYAGFTRMAGGSTPYPAHQEHIRRFFEHKLNVDVERYGTPSCVGCGRCIQTCPGNISIRRFIEEAVKP